MRVGEIWHLPADGALIAAGDTAVFDVVIRNLSTGHRFPAGARRPGRVRLGRRAGRPRRRDRHGRRRSPRGRDDPSAHILRAIVADSDGTPRYARDTQNFRAAIVNHTIAARDAAATRYRLKVPARVRAPLRVEARLLHRSRNPIVARLACEAQRSERGEAFAAHSAAERRALDGCVAPPVTEIARRRGGRRRSDTDARPVVGRAAVRARHGARPRGLRKARPGPGAARAGLELTDLPRQRAAIYAELAKVAGRQGRTDEALGFADKAAAIVGPAPPLDKIRGDALSRVWRWREARDALERATAGAPGNPAGWRALAIARGSLGEHRQALAAAVAGLALTPRDSDMLRVQALALAALEIDPAVAARALDAYDAHRPPDRATDIRVECARSVPGCATERQPVHAHDLTPR